MSKSNSKSMGLLLVAAGVFLGLFGQFFLGKVSETVANRIAISFKGVQVKFTGSLFNVFGFSIPRNLSFLINVNVRNDNNVGGTITGVFLSIRYGRGGTVLAKVTSANFLLPPRDSIQVEMRADIDLVTAPQTVAEVARQVKDGALKKLWIDGSINTNFGPIPIDQEISILEA